ncbi:MAG: TIGR00159 family protein, partial [Candidatus Delongbacteria bacterium]|nr:TIGR00159 family protein [Candidatus Delongbacteria bacterium]
MHLFNIGFVSFTLVDLADILLFTAMFYKLFTMLKDSRATTMFLGLFTVVLIGIIADFLNLSIMSWLLSSITTIFWL